MKKIFSFILLFISILSLSGCNNVIMYEDKFADGLDEQTFASLLYCLYEDHSKNDLNWTDSVNKIDSKYVLKKVYNSGDVSLYYEEYFADFEKGNYEMTKESSYTTVDGEEESKSVVYEKGKYDGNYFVVTDKSYKVDFYEKKYLTNVLKNELVENIVYMFDSQDYYYFIKPIANVDLEKYGIEYSGYCRDDNGPTYSAKYNGMFVHGEYTIYKVDILVVNGVIVRWDLEYYYNHVKYVYNIENKISLKQS